MTEVFHGESRGGVWLWVERDNEDDDVAVAGVGLRGGEDEVCGGDRGEVISYRGGRNFHVSGFGVILENGSNIIVEVSLRFEFLTTNNQAEYKVGISRMTLAEEMGAEHIKLQIELQLVISHVRGESQAQDVLL
ncbi:hypothetical protein KIW84_012370 [Lathyrus oleraceus]|uniref:Uncharacterized protein n=1 Tax=Pisum sativum TaxID=3888 RepID=A0A9D5GWI2_PEA|nr:hypothetical protein KIW84_012370 [Pisum sativum]